MERVNIGDYDPIILEVLSIAEFENEREIGEVVEMMLHTIKNIPGNPFKYSLEAFNL